MVKVCAAQQTRETDDPGLLVAEQRQLGKIIFNVAIFPGCREFLNDMLWTGGSVLER